MKTLYLLAFSIFWHGSAHSSGAEKVVEKAITELKLEAKTKTGFLSGLLYGAGQAYGWANIELERHKLKPMFCPPPLMGLEVSNYLRIATLELEHNRGLYNIAFSKDSDFKGVAVYALLEGLKNTLPCK